MEGRPKDVAALFERAGQGKSGSYREFSSARAIARKLVLPGEEQVSMIASTEQIQVLGPVEITAAPASRAALQETMAPGSLTAAAPGYPAPAEATTPALDRLFAGNPARRAKAAPEQNCCTVAFFSLAGGVGKTTLAISVGRILSERGMRVVLANWSRAFAYQHLMGSRAQTVGSLVFLHAPSSVTAPPMILIECGELAAAGEEQEAVRLVEQAACRADVTLVDLPTSLDQCTHKLLLHADHVVVPLLPDLQSAATLDLLDELLLEGMPENQGGSAPEVHYVLNRYQSSRALHREAFDRLRGRLGYHLLPTYIHDEHAVPDAMWSGVTVVDHAPNSAVNIDLHAVANSIRQLSPRRSVRKGTTA
jgi:cellulose biosynthesis protein BcsQ